MSAASIERCIFPLRGHRIILGGDLAVFYDVEPQMLSQAVKRNMDRFPDDFMFVLTAEEWQNLRSQNVTSSWGGARSTPMAFTEQGVAMLSSVLRSDRAVQVNIQIMRTFVQMRRVLTEHKELAAKLTALERKYDDQFKVVFDAIRQMMTPRWKRNGRYAAEAGAAHSAGGSGAESSRCSPCRQRRLFWTTGRSSATLDRHAGASSCRHWQNDRLP
ncbi:MAG: ORF6N domain-containing protein [Sulfurisoma sp.]|nr:ORF6N domain-containing protein [Sulfurisoma sp.]